MAKKYKSIEIQGWINNQTFSAWFNRLYSMALSTFEWTGLPSTVDPRFLEMVLFWRGFGVYFADEVMGQLFLPMATASQLDIYGYPILRQAVSYNYTSKFLSNEDSVLIYDNLARAPLAQTMRMYAMRLWQIDCAIDVNANAQKTPVLSLCDTKERLSLENLYQQYNGNMPVIFGSKGLDPSSFTVLKTEAPFHGQELQALKRQIMEEALTYLGIEANTNDKAERLVSNEITSNMGGIESMRLNRLTSRQQAVEKINKMFGLNVEVRFNSSLQLSQLMDGGMIYPEGGEGNGPVHDGSENDV